MSPNLKDTLVFHKACGNQLYEIGWSDWGLGWSDWGYFAVCWACRKDFFISLGDDWDNARGIAPEYGDGLDKELESYEWDLVNDKELIG